MSDNNHSVNDSTHDPKTEVSLLDGQVHCLETRPLHQRKEPFYRVKLGLGRTLSEKNLGNELNEDISGEQFGIEVELPLGSLRRQEQLQIPQQMHHEKKTQEEPGERHYTFCLPASSLTPSMHS